MEYRVNINKETNPVKTSVSYINKEIVWLVSTHSKLMIKLFKFNNILKYEEKGISDFVSRLVM